MTSYVKYAAHNWEKLIQQNLIRQLIYSPKNTV